MKQNTPNIIICPNSTDLPIEDTSIDSYSKLNKALKKISEAKKKRSQRRKINEQIKNFRRNNAWKNVKK